MNNKILTLVLSAAVLGPVSASAEISFYGGLGVGGARTEGDVDLTFSAFEYDGTDLIPVFDRVGDADSNPNFGRAAQGFLEKAKGSDLGYRVFAGVRLGEYLGIEAGYVNLGAAEDDIALNIPPRSGPSADNILCDNCRPETDVLLALQNEVDGWDLYLLGALPITDRWEAIAKVGIITWSADFTAKNAFRETFPPSPPGTTPFLPTTEPASFAVSSDGTDLAGAVGIQYKATEHIAFRGEGTWYDIEDTSTAWLLGVNIVVTY